MTAVQNAGRSRREPAHTALGTLTAGAVIGVVEVVIASSFAALIFRGRLTGYVAEGVGINLGAAAAAMTTIALLSGRRGVIGSAQDGPAAVLAVVAGAAGAVAVGSEHTAFLTVVATIAVASGASGLVLLLVGWFRLGDVVRFVPHPVMGGFLAGTGWLLTRGSIDVMAGIDPSLGTLDDLAERSAVVRWLPGAVLAVVLIVLTRKRSGSLTIPVTLGAAVVTFAIGILVTGSSIDELEADGWLLGPFPGSDLWRPWIASAVRDADWSAVAAQAGGIATAVFVTLVGLLLNASGLEMVLERDLDLNRELRTAGVANAAAGVAGGVPGFHAVSLTLLARRLDAPARSAALVAAAVVVLSLVAGASVIELIPRAVLGGLLLFLGLSFLVEWVVDARRSLATGEYAIVLAILATIVGWGLLPGVAIGLALAVGLFAVSYGRIDLVSQSLTASSHHSNVARSHADLETLRRRGDEAAILRLHGFLFFGTANSLFERIRRRASDDTLPRLRFLLLDLRRVTGIDSSAAMSFRKIAALADARSFTVVLASATEEVRKRLDRNGVRADGPAVRYVADLDRGLQLYEDDALAGEPSRSVGRARAVWDWLDEPGGATLERLEPFVERIAVAPGDEVIHQGDPSDDVFLVEDGRLTVEMRTARGETIRLRSMGRGTVVGEMRMYTGAARTARVVAETAGVVHRLTRASLERMEHDEPELAAALHRSFARMLAERLSESLRTVERLLD